MALAMVFLREAGLMKDHFLYFNGECQKEQELLE